jgi:flagellar hook-associated protein 1
MSLLTNALSGATAAQAALDASSQNTANEQTAGYSRQGVVLASVQPLYDGTQVAGSGVAVTSIQRFSNEYTNVQLWNAGSSLGASTSAQSYLTQLEQVMGDATAGIGTGLQNFTGALNAASENPSSDPLRQQVIASAQSLAQQFNSQTQLMNSQMNGVDQQRSSIVTQINQITATIAGLNSQIVQAKGSGVNANGLLDARDQQIGALASLASVQVTQQANGSEDVTLSGGQPLVEGSIAATVSATANPDDTQTLSLSFANSSFTLGGDLGGQLGGLLTFQTGTLQPMMQQIGAMAQQVATSYNAQLEAGYSPAGTAGTPLFQYTGSGATGTLAVTAGIESADLAFSSDPTSSGDSGNLTQLIALGSQAVALPGLGSVTLSDAMTQIVGTLGTTSQANQSAASTAQTVSDQAESNWQSISGVSSDEEATNLVQYQQMYQANMQVIQVANTLFASTLNMFNPTSSA